jgi:ABC-type thiamine transport system ATPase subunit
VGAPLTSIQLLGLTSQSFGPSSIELSKGLWVILADSDKIATQFTRLVVGLDKPRRGQLLINGYSPRHSPNRRKSIASLLSREDFSFADTVANAIREVTAFKDIPLDVVSVLQPLAIGSLAARTTRSLTVNESRQVALALALAQGNPKVAVFCEPLVSLSNAQQAELQSRLVELSLSSCVLCVTSSAYDARQLGGPHAQMTARGWSWFERDALQSPQMRVVIEGPTLRRLAAELTMLDPIARLSLQVSCGAHEALEIVGMTKGLSSDNIVSIARQLRTSITRLFVEGMGGSPLAATSHPYAPRISSQTTSPTHQVARIVVAKAVTHSHLSVASRKLATGVGYATLLGEPLAASAYAGLHRSAAGSQAIYDALVFLTTVLAPIWSLLVCRVVCANSALGNDVELIARYGVDRRILGLVRVVLVSFLNAALAVVSSGAAVLFALNGWVPTQVDLASALWIGGLSGAVYGALAISVTTATGWQKSRLIFVLLDFVLGGTSHSLSFPFPRAHIHNLLGSASAIEFPQRGSCIVLGSLWVLALGLACVRTDR